MATAIIDREQFLAERRSGIGGSDAHHLLNIEPYGCQRMLWHDKVGIEPDEEFEVTGAIRRGNRLEEIAAEYYAQKTGRVVKPIPHVRHPEHPWLVVHIDRAIYADDHEGPGVLECKVIGWQMLKKIQEDGIPTGYVAQVQWGMMATQFTWGSFAVYEPSTDRLISWDYKPNKKLQALLFEAGKEQWDRIQRKDPPPRLNPLSVQCAECRWRRSCQGEAMADLPIDADAQVIDDKRVRAWVEVYAQYHAIEKAAKEEKDKAKEQIAKLIGDATKVYVPPRNGQAGGTIHFGPRRGWNLKKLRAEKPSVYQKFCRKVDETALSEAHPELMAKYKDPTGARPMRIDLKLDEKG